MNGFWESAGDLERAGTEFVVVTLVGTRGHAPQDPGAKAIMTAEGLHFGTVGGGKIEAHCLREAQRMLAEPAETGATAWSGAPDERDSPAPGRALRAWNLQRDIGMTCGGEATFLFERHAPAAWSIVVFGAGHVAQALARVLEPLACRATFVDNRSEWLERLPKSPRIRPVLVAEPVDYVAKLRGDEYCVVMTRGHASDLPVHAALFARADFPPFVGGLGSDVKAAKMRTELKALAANPAETERRLAAFRCPIGLPFGTNDPAEIALSVAAQLLQERDRAAAAKRVR